MPRWSFSLLPENIRKSEVFKGTERDKWYEMGNDEEIKFKNNYNAALTSSMITSNIFGALM